MNQDMKINVEELDKEWMLLPQVYEEYSQHAEMTDIELRKAKMKLDIRRADISKHIREHSREYAAEYGVTSLTEGFISTLIDSDDEVKQIQLEIISLERNKRLYNTAVKGLEMKRDALKNLTALFQSQYFSIPQITRRIEEYKQAQEKFEGRDIRREIKQNLRRKTRTTQENQ